MSGAGIAPSKPCPGLEVNNPSFNLRQCPFHMVGELRTIIRKAIAQCTIAVELPYHRCGYT
ncbi:hypothetical protein H6G97_06850 [Nostoc flagelliforme FACHB-838]|uniref:Transposase n=1 Tax=Nostoc flagelliforme FACHB-838 TaxID=2692904 RepID=A0ABR8DL77_9NOSO|nr:hypothetical protein [Nostoc flagelliforme FACHB-838]